jgi:hypothetical protein
VRRAREAGQVLPLAAVCLAALLGFAGMSVDVGYWESRQQAQQAATDAAAVGGAQQLVHSGCGNSQAATTAADNDASSNGFANGTNATITVQNPPATGPYAGNDCAVFVQIATTQASFFSRLFGYGNGMPETTQGTATLSSSATNGCIYLLSTNTWSSFNDATVSSPGCAIAINYSADFNGGTITAPFIGYAGGKPNYGGTVFPQASPVPMLPIADPCTEISGCSYLASNPPPQTNCQTLNENGISMTINPGCYQNLNLNAPTTMKSGTYVIAGNMNLNSGYTLTGSGITIYVPAGGNPPNFDGGTVTLTPPTPGPSQNAAGVLYYQVPSNSSSINFNGPNVNMSGLIYAPGSNSANFDGANGNYVVLVFGSANFNGNTAYDFASPPPGGSLVQQAILTQ